MVALSIFCLSLAAQAAKPPKVRYDAKRDVTTYSTGDIRTAGYSGYGVRFEFPGKTFSEPKSIAMGFGALRTANGQDDEALQHWKGVDSVTIRFGSQSLTLPAEHEFKLSTDSMVKTFIGRAFEESLSVTLTPDQLKQLATVDALQVQLGKDKQDIKGKSLGPLKQLAATFP